MGISLVVGLQATILLLSFLYLKIATPINWSSIREEGGWPGWGLPSMFLRLYLLHASLIGFLIAAASHPSINTPLLLGKKPDGTFPIWSMLLFSPFLIFIRIYAFAKKYKRKTESGFTQVAEGLYVGRWPSLCDGNLPADDPAIIDCTCELPRSSSVLRNSPYICVPTWDTRSPSPEGIESAVRWACGKRAQNKPVYIHCAFGHGRSVCVTCAVMVAMGKAEDWKIAEKMVKEKRPFIRMNALHRANLEDWSKRRSILTKN
ncbi:Dual specificity phosphatase, catalytic domain containing protein,expressed [Zostera marina]|uniref:Dual specificity phosphatase, catalytic domain containing protein,expressed n=1 Tax=Zostera marina TaxID=29655 RepID=A0A0K9NLY2_ZOSMR|nr:Dual specificity phosphatase, catalytic domain containing protein,expressed [Zostera marina]